VPGYLEAQEELKKTGVDEVLVYCVNDGAVMDAWGEDQKIGDSMITFLADPRSEVTGALGMILDHPGPISKLGYNRSKRFAMYIVNGVIKAWKVSEAPDDPAGDDDPSATLAPAMIEEINKLAPADKEL
jgi:2-Cys peroxiredoxin 5